MNTSDWDIDATSGHLAHPSGLHAYIVAPPNDFGGVNCVGPFSSHKCKLKRREVCAHTADAIRAIENLDLYKGCFTYWGSIINKAPRTDNRVKILDREFDFLPKPCFRSDILLRSNEAHIDSASIAVEWTYSYCLTRIDHNMGSSFFFPPDQQRLTTIVGRVLSIADDLADLDPKIRPLMVKALGSLAVAVQQRLGTKRSKPLKKKLRLNLEENLLLAS